MLSKLPKNAGLALASLIVLVGAGTFSLQSKASPYPECTSKVVKTIQTPRATAKIYNGKGVTCVNVYNKTAKPEILANMKVLGNYVVYSVRPGKDLSFTLKSGKDSTEFIVNGGGNVKFSRGNQTVTAVDLP